MAAPQQTIGSYRITSKLGAGGMGEVWRATDTRLNRDVAVKVLPAAFASDPLRMARFAREAQVLASLNHPGIATIYGVEQSALVMELVEGPTLAERIAKGAIPLEEALPIATQIAEALEYAHERGVVHRDLKPANIKITPEGRVKILDFGLAKAVSADESSASADAATLSSPATLAGTILGTAAYMSPEQARGQAVDRRCDVWAFGVVLYEMLTGTRPFGGATVSDTLASVLAREPEVARLPAATRPIISGCLRKDQRQRYQWIGDVRLALAGDLPAQAPTAAAQPARARITWGATALVCLAAGVAMAWWFKPAPKSEVLVGRFSISLPAGQSFHRVGRHVLAISPDGSKIVYNATDSSGNHLYLRSLNALEAQIVPGTAPDMFEPVFSPDGQWIAYFTPTHPVVLQKIPVAGGAPVTLCTLKGAVFGASWSDGRIVFGDGGGVIESVPDSGGAPQTIASAAAHAEIAGPQLIDHGRRLLFTMTPAEAQPGGGQIVIQDAGLPASSRTLLTGGSDARLLTDGRLIYFHEGTLFGVRVSLSRGSIIGAPVPLIEGVSGAVGDFAAQYATSASGTLVYRPGIYRGVATPPSELMWVDQHGHESATDAPVHSYLYPRISPDGKLVAVSTLDNPADLWIWDTVRSTFSRLTFGAGPVLPAWSSSGAALYFSGAGQKVYRQAVDGTGQPVPVSGPADYLETVSPDGRFAVLMTPSTRAMSLELMPLQPPGQEKALLVDARFSEHRADLSPNGDWLAYVSNETGQTEVYVRPFPNVTGGRWQISAGGGDWPAWSRDGRTLYYLSQQPQMRMMAVAAQFQPTFSAGEPRPLFQFVYQLGNHRTFDVAPDGRFLVAKRASATASHEPPTLTLVTNWDHEVAARVH